jgi:hypothetical protein
MVQNMGNSWRADWDNLRDAMEKSRTYEPEKRVCIESDSYRQLSAGARNTGSAPRPDISGGSVFTGMGMKG